MFKFFSWISSPRHLVNIANEAAFSEIKEGIMVIDHKNRIMKENPSCADIFSSRDWNREGTDISLTPEGKYILDHPQPEFEMEIIKNDEARFYEIRRSLLNDQSANSGFLFIFRDITEQKELLHKIGESAILDSLTEIYNRRKLVEETENELLRMKRYGNCLSVLMIDIDHLKFVNDQYGYQSGDDVVRILAGICKERLRRTDIIGRYDGEEFLILLPETDEENAFLVAELLRKKIAAAEIVSNQELIHVTVSIGIKTIFRSDEVSNVGNLIHCAESALYHVKRSGRNGVSATADLSPHSFLSINNSFSDI